MQTYHDVHRLSQHLMGMTLHLLRKQYQEPGLGVSQSQRRLRAWLLKVWSLDWGQHHRELDSQLTPELAQTT